MLASRDSLVKWALSTPKAKAKQGQAIAEYLKGLRGKALSVFVNEAGFAAVVALARQGRQVEAEELVSDLRDAATKVGCAKAIRLVNELASDLATYNAGVPAPIDDGLLRSALAAFRFAR